MAYNLFLDDLRDVEHASIFNEGSLEKVSGIPREEWIVVRNFEQFKYMVDRELPDVVSFDHDLCREHILYYFQHAQQNGYIEYENLINKTGKHCAEYLVAKWIENGKSKQIKTFVHSANEIGSEEIRKVLQKLNE